MNADMPNRNRRYRLGVDVGGTFTDLLLIDQETGRTFSAKVPSTPEDSSIGVLNGIVKISAEAAIDPGQIDHVLHGTTVATNAILTSSGAKVGLVTTKGFRQVLQIARSFVPGGLGGWVIWNKRPPLAPLELTIEADERMTATGEILEPLDVVSLRPRLELLRARGIEALTICLFNAYANDENERRIRAIAQAIMPNIPVSISSEVVPEMYEYERTETTVVNSYVRPAVSRYVDNLHTELGRSMGHVNLHVLRSDGGLASVDSAKSTPVTLLMSGPAGGVTGALWTSKTAGFDNFLTFDMGGTSTDVALIEKGVAQTRRETRVADVVVRAPSIDVRSVGAGGGSIAYVPELTKALRVGPRSAGAKPGPAAYCKGGVEPTVTDANVVLGYLPTANRLGGDMEINRGRAEAAVQKIADALGTSLKAAAEGIINIVNENMFGALRLVSIEQGYDPRNFALIAFGGAGPLHANALGRLMGSWPVIIPRAPGVLCAYGDATTRLRNEATRTAIRRFDATDDATVLNELEELAIKAAGALDAEQVPPNARSTIFQIDVRYHGQGMGLPITLTSDVFRSTGLNGLAKQFDDLHTQLFTFALDAPHELVTLRAVVQGPDPLVRSDMLERGGTDPQPAFIETTSIFVNGNDVAANVYERAKLMAGNLIRGPAIVTQMDTTTLILPGHAGEVDETGCILIRPSN
jgi:N-methylhydantoinase A